MSPRTRIARSWHAAAEARFDPLANGDGQVPLTLGTRSMVVACEVGESGRRENDFGLSGGWISVG